MSKQTLQKQKTIGINPLEQYLSRTQQEPSQLTQELVTPQPQHQSSIVPALSSSANCAEQEIEASTKQRITIHLSTELIDRVKNAVFWEPGLTLAAFAEYALHQAIEKLEHERGAAYPKRREQNLRGGRPLK